MRTGEASLSFRQRKTTVAIVTGVVILTSLWYLSFARDSQAAGNAGAAGTARCLGRAATIVGNSGNNDIHGTSGPDVIQAGAGNDDVNGGAGDDLICGGAGNDDLHGGLGRDRFSGGPGVDDIHQVGSGENGNGGGNGSGGGAGSGGCDHDAHPDDPCTPNENESEGE